MAELLQMLIPFFNKTLITHFPSVSLLPLSLPYEI